MYTYKHYNDSVSYPNHNTLLFETFEEARDQLELIFTCNYPEYGKTIEEIKTNPAFNDAGIGEFGEDRICIEIADTQTGICEYYIVEPISIEHDNMPLFNIRFTDPVDDAHTNFTDKPNSRFTVADIYAYSEDHLLALMERVADSPLGMWYWVTDLRTDTVILSGACDPNDADIVREYLGIGEEETT